MMMAPLLLLQSSMSLLLLLLALAQCDVCGCALGSLHQAPSSSPLWRPYWLGLLPDIWSLLLDEETPENRREKSLLLLTTHTM